MLLQVLLAGLACCTSSAKRNRLQCIGAVIPLLHEQDAAQFSESIAAFLGEVVLGVKEVNVKTRVTAYDLLVKIARNFEGQVCTKSKGGEKLSELCGLDVVLMSIGFSEI